MIITEPAHECVSTGNIISLSGLWSFLTLEIIAAFPRDTFAIMIMIALVILFGTSWGHKTVNDTADINSYFNKKIMVKKDVFEVKMIEKY